SRRKAVKVASVVAMSPRIALLYLRCFSWGARWWWSPVDLDHQHLVDWLVPGVPPPVLAGADKELEAWQAAEEEDRARERPEDPSAPWSGRWWSTPGPSRLHVTTRALPAGWPVGLALAEDLQGFTEARTTHLRPRPGLRVYEVTGPPAWTALVSRYPLAVTRSRRHDWWRVTGWAGDWLIPDWKAVSSDYDAVHLSVGGYLGYGQDKRKRRSRPGRSRLPRIAAASGQRGVRFQALSGHPGGRSCETTVPVVERLYSSTGRRSTALARSSAVGRV
ncbi:MAG: hypothetical protein ACRD0J_02395, partial [Acidimicrobiales bacterium]